MLRTCCSDQIVKHQFADLIRTTRSEFSQHIADIGWSVSIENSCQLFTPLVVSIKLIKGPKGRKIKRYFVYFFTLSRRHGLVENEDLRLKTQDPKTKTPLKIARNGYLDLKYVRNNKIFNYH